MRQLTTSCSQWRVDGKTFTQTSPGLPQGRRTGWPPGLPERPPVSVSSPAWGSPSPKQHPQPRTTFCLPPAWMGGSGEAPGAFQLDIKAVSKNK